MFRSIGSFLLTAVLLYSAAVAQEKNFGLGIIAGDPTGLSGKFWTENRTAFDAAVAWSFGKESKLYLHGDYLFYNFNLFKVESGQLPFYYGIGGKLKLGGESTVGIRIPVGLNYIFANAPLDVFFEIVPVLNLVPGTEIDLNGGVGIRYFFNYKNSKAIYSDFQK
ncbi:MAG TPA: hypothetical protein DHW42_11230 [Candidatus Marinimicrobia bacterium]|nr:hypothetical protein [Candidatus Neomarinimicrobiota bacterium]